MLRRRACWGRVGRAEVVYRGCVDYLTGYGKHGVDVVRGLRRLGYAMDVQPSSVWEPWGFALPADIRGNLVDWSAAPTELLLLPPPHAGLPGKRTVHYTMWESSELLPEVVANLNRQDELILPCQWNADCFRACGVTVPIHVVPLYVDLDVYTPAPMAMDGPLVIGCGGRMAHGGIRKGIQECIDTFREAFPSERGVCLEVKIFPDCPLPGCSDPRVRIIREPWSGPQMARWYRNLTCYLSMALAEGFGLMPIQAMACGRPVVLTLAHGHLEYANASVAYPVEWRLEDCAASLPGQSFYHGEWYRPSRVSAAEQLRSIYRDRETARAKGLAGAARALDFAPERHVVRLAEILFPSC